VTLLFPFLSASGQIQISSVQVTVTDPSGALVRDARVVLSNSINHSSEVGIADGSGTYVFNNVPFDRYTLTIEAPGFRPATPELTVRSNLPVVVKVALTLAGSQETMRVQARSGLVEGEHRDRPCRGSNRATPRSGGSRQLRQIVATTPGMVTENDGLLHVRGVDDGVLYVVDGIPIMDRVVCSHRHCP